MHHLVKPLQFKNKSNFITSGDNAEHFTIRVIKSNINWSKILNTTTQILCNELNETFSHILTKYHVKLTVTEWTENTSNTSTLYNITTKYKMKKSQNSTTPIKVYLFQPLETIWFQSVLLHPPSSSVASKSISEIHKSPLNSFPM